MSADSTGTPETPSASSTERRIELTVESRLTIAPLRRPLDSAAPSARNLTSSSAGIRIQNHLASVLQVNGLHATCVRLPLREIFDQHAIFPGELARTEMQSNSLRHVQSWKPGHNDSEVLRVSQIGFADEVRRTRTDQI